MARDWRSAFLDQARSDYRMLKLLLAREDVPPCQRLHYLPMATEKLAKGLLTPAGAPPPGKSHNAFSRFVIIAKGRADIRDACGFKKREQFVAYLNKLEPYAKQVEDLSPEGDDHPNPEYPWSGKLGVVSPVEYGFADLDLQSPRMIKLLKFVEDCFSIASP